MEEKLIVVRGYQYDVCEDIAWKMKYFIVH